MNYRGEEFPPDMDGLVAKIKHECSTVFEDNKCHRITDIFSFDEVGQNIRLRRDFLAAHRELFNEYGKEIKGLYIFRDAVGTAFFVGASRTVARSLRHHFFGAQRHQDSLVYLMALEEQKASQAQLLPGSPRELSFDQYRPTIQKRLRDTTFITIKPVSDSFELYLSELYYACELKTFWNSFAID